MPSIKDIVAGQSVGVGKRVIKAGADKLRGIINDRGLGKMPSFKHFSMVNLTYPLDVAEDPRQGHYVIFTVRELANKAKINAEGEISVIDKDGNRVDFLKEKVTTDEFNGLVSDYNNPSVDANDIVNQKKGNTVNKVRTVKDNFNTNGKEKRTFERKYFLRPASTRTSTLITLYMPPQVKNITGAEYEAAEMAAMTGGLGAIATAAFREDVGIEDVGLGSSLKQFSKWIGGMMEGIGFQGISDAFQLTTGIALADRMEFVFKNPKKRAFPYQFDFYPKSEQEAQEVHKIIQTFRQHMLPKIANQDSMRGVPVLYVPNQFNIEYYYKGNQNNFLNKIGTCYLTDCDVTYGGDRYTAFTESRTKDGEPGASPTEIHLNLNFQELDIITHEDVKEGY